MATVLSEFTPRERQSAWQRWELAALPAAPPAAEAGPDVSAAAEAAAARAQALDAARAAGYAEGRAAAAAEQARLQRLLETLAATIAGHEQQLVDEVLDLALVLARQIVGDAIALRRDILLPVVTAALRQLPQASQRIELIVNPSDFELVHGYVETATLAPRCHVVSNAAIAPGGCRIETEQCEVDATVGARWKRLLASLGRSDDWLELA